MKRTDLDSTPAATNREPANPKPRSISFGLGLRLVMGAAVLVSAIALGVAALHDECGAVSREAGQHFAAHPESGRSMAGSPFDLGRASAMRATCS